MKWWACLVAIGAVALAGQAHAAVKITPLAHYWPMSQPGQGVLLISPDGTPIGGKWQRWTDEARVPTVSENVRFFDDDVSGCTAGADGCAIGTTPTVYLAADARRPALYHELGHLFDFAVLTDAERLRFMRIWGWPLMGQPPTQAWWRGESHADPIYGRGPAGEWFAEGYRLCATFGRWTWNTAFSESWYQYRYPAHLTWEIGIPMWRQRWALRAQRATCRLIRAAARP